MKEVNQKQIEQSTVKPVSQSIISSKSQCIWRTSSPMNATFEVGYSIYQTF